MSEEIVETAKAVQETAKTTGKAIDLLGDLGGWLGELVGQPIASAIGYHITDRLQAKRYEAAIYDKARLLDLMRKVGIEHEGKDLNIRALPPKVGIPLLEAASREYEDDLHTLWAKLLATAIDDDAEPVERQFVSILVELSSADACALVGLWEQQSLPFNLKPTPDGLKTYAPSLDTSAWGERVAASLTSLGLVTASNVEFPLFSPDGDQSTGWHEGREDSVSVPGDFVFVVFTDLGRDFCRAIGMAKPRPAEKPK